MTYIVFDVYRSCSLKAKTRSKREFGVMRRVTDKGKNPQNWQSFLRYNTNKTERFDLLATKVVELCITNSVCVTREDSVVCNISVNLEGISACNHVLYMPYMLQQRKEHLQ